MKLAHFALVNLLAGRTLVPELLPLLDDGQARAAQLRGLEEVRASLGEPGAPRRVAQELARSLEP